MTPKARNKLKKNLEQRGLLNSPVWNRRTGMLVSGHQRLSILDALMGTSDYELFVDAVDLTEKEQREQNIFMNNTEAQGDWEIDRLKLMFAESDDKKIEPNLAGFDPGIMFSMFGDGGTLEPNQLQELSEAVRKNMDLVKKISAAGLRKDEREYYLVVVFADDFTKDYVQHHMGLPPGRFVDGKVFLDQLHEKLDVPMPAAAEDL